MKSLLQLALSLTVITTSTTVFSQTPIKRVLVEESTGTWCASCAYGSIYFNHLKNNYPNTIPVAIHTQDPMSILSIEFYMLDYFGGSPTFLLDRTDFPENHKPKPSISASVPWEYGLDTLDFYMDKIYNSTPLATIGITQSYNESTREITATINTTFLQSTTGNFRLNCFILEDSVTGGSTYDQANSNFSGWTSGPSYLQSLINQPSLISGYVHDHVLRATLGTPEGAAASIPTNISSGGSYDKTFTYTIPAGYNPEHISLVGVLQRYGSNKVADRTIVNAYSEYLNEPGSSTNVKDINADFVNFSVYPNPINNNSRIEFSLKEAGYLSCSLYNLQGKLVKNMFSKNLSQGEYKLDMGNLNDLSNGIYLLRFSNNEKSSVKRLVINK